MGAETTHACGGVAGVGGRGADDRQGSRARGGGEVRATPVARGGGDDSGRQRGGRRGDRGQATPLAAAMLAVAMVALVALVPAAQAVADRTRARTAADAAALAGAADGERAARAVAGANGGELLEFRRDGDEVVVRVQVGDVDAYARARATRRPAPEAGGGATDGGGDRSGLAPAMLAALARADGLLGYPVPVASGLRTRAEQEALWERRHTNPYPVARPGTSDHERGLAIDVPQSHVDDLLAVAPAAGLCQPLPETDPVHFVICGGS